MALDATASAPSRPLPPLGAFLRALIDLGRRSIPIAIPALVFLWFYHVGMALYLEVSGAGTSPLGYRDNNALLIHALMQISAYLPLLVLVYMPFLPLQDALLRGERITFFAAARHVLERMVPLVLCLILQCLIFVAPLALMTAVVAAVIAGLPDLPGELMAGLAFTVVVPVVMWILAYSFLMAFALPGVILSGLGPWRAITKSARLASEHVIGLVGRFIVFLLVLIFAALILSIPTGLLRVAGAAVGSAEPALRLVGILWSSLVTSFLFPFWVASLLVLYRALVPRPAPGTEEGATAALAMEDQPAPGPVPPELAGTGGAPAPAIPRAGGPELPPPGERPSPLPFE